MKRITILGASGHGKVVADIAKLNGYDEIEFLDDDRSITRCGDYPVVGVCDEAEACDNDIFVAIGNAQYRRQYLERFFWKSIPVLIHPSAVIAEGVSIGRGTVLMAGTVVNPGTVVGRGCIINTCSSVDHDCRLDDYTHVAVGAHLCGTVQIGEYTWIGAGATIGNNVTICDNCMVGAGAVVVRDISESGTYVGVPARKLKGI